VVVRVLLEKGAAVDATEDKDEATVLMKAAFHGNEGAMCLLLEKGRRLTRRTTTARPHS